MHRLLPEGRRHPVARCLAGLVLLAAAMPASATFSIVACDADGSCGVAVATNNHAVGATVPYARAGVGALVSQFETNPHYGPKGLALLAEGRTPEATIRLLLDGDGDFDGTTIAERQIGVVDARGHAATYTGEAALRSAWAGAVHGERHAVQGIGLAGAAVLSAMQQAFLARRGPLAERLIASLEAGQAAGGQTTGRRSAALLVRTREGDWQDVDLRVDAAAEPIADLRRLYDQHEALQAIIRAERFARRGKPAEARTAIADALGRAHGWDRIWRRAARLAMTMDERDRARDYLAVFRSINPVWARIEVDDPLYRPLHADPLFERWRR